MKLLTQAAEARAMSNVLPYRQNVEVLLIFLELVFLFKCM